MLMKSVLQDLSAPSLAKAIEENLHELLATSLQWPRRKLPQVPSWSGSFQATILQPLVRWDGVPAYFGTIL